MLFLIGATGGLGNGLCELLESSPDTVQLYGGLRLVTRGDMDLTSETSIRDYWSRTIGDLPGNEPVYVINAAGFSASGFAHKYRLEDWQKSIAINLTANFLIIRELCPAFKNRPGSSMVILSSVVADTGVPGTIAYSSSKSGLKGLIRTAAREIARHKATINAIELGYFDKGMIEQVAPAALEKLMTEIPLGRLGTVPELMQACNFLLRCPYMTGTLLRLNGGLI